MKSLHCPNPRCTNTFSAADVQRTGAVKCPQCGQEFRFRPPGQTPPQPVAPPVAPIAVPVAAAPPKKTSQVAPPTPVQKPKAMPKAPVAPKPAPLPPPVAKSEKLVRVRGPQPSGGNAVKIGILAVVLLILGGAGFFIVRTLVSRTPPVDPNPPPVAPPIAGTIHHFKVPTLRGGSEKALTLTVDLKEWFTELEKKLDPKADEKLLVKGKLKATVVFKPADGDVSKWFAVAVQDFGTRKPRDAELLDGAINRLNNLFADLQINSSKLERGQLGGRDAVHCSFIGQTPIPWQGEVYLTTKDGFGYWIFFAAPTIDDAQKLAKQLDDAKTFSFATERPDWIDQPPLPESFSAAEAVFTVKAPDNVWKQYPAKAEDDAGVIFLAGSFQNLQGNKVEKSPAKNATLLGVALDKRGDLREAFKETLAYFEKRKQAENPDYRFVPHESGANLLGELEPVGDLPGCVGELKLARGNEVRLNRYVLLAVFNDGSKTYGLQFDCPWNNRTVWQKEFRDMLKTVRLGQK